MPKEFPLVLIYKINNKGDTLGILRAGGCARKLAVSFGILRGPFRDPLGRFGGPFGGGPVDGRWDPKGTRDFLPDRKGRNNNNNAAL